MEKLLVFHSKIQASEYAEAAEVSIRQARKDLGELEELGLLERRDRGPSTVYQRVNKGFQE